MYIPTIQKGVLDAMAVAIFEDGAQRVTKFLTEHMTVKMTRKVYGKNKRFGLGKKIDIVLTVGTPNYAECKFIKEAKEAGEPFPVKKMLIKFPK